MYQAFDIESSSQKRERPEIGNERDGTRKVVGIVIAMMLVLGTVAAASTWGGSAKTETKTNVMTNVKGDHHHHHHHHGHGHNHGVNTLIRSGSFKIVNVNSGKAAEVEGGYAHLGARVIQNGLNNGPSQEWQLVSAGSNGNVMVKSVATGMCWAVKSGKLVQWPCSGGAQFQFVRIRGGAVKILVVNSGKAVTVPGGSQLGKVQLVASALTGRNNQKFRLFSVYGGSGSSPACPSPIVRRDFRDLTQQERDTFLKGFRALRSNDRLLWLAFEHREALLTGFDSLTFHGNIGFFPWHRYFAWELEHQIRALGGEYACVALPYWDWTRTSGLPVADNPMFSQGVGGNGSPPGGCVPDGLLGEPTGYTTSYGQCLKRDFAPGIAPYPTTQQVLELVELVQNYSSFRAQIEGFHNGVHGSIGADLVNLSTTTDDALFFMLHSYVDMTWALRADCHDYDQATTVTPEIFPEPWKVMSYPFLANTSWALVSRVTLTAADLLKTQDWGYTYDASDMMTRTCMAMATCKFDTIFGRVAAQEDIVMAAVDGKTDKEKAHNACVRDAHCNYTEPLETCPPGPQPLQISLAELLNKKGVKGNTCIENARREAYVWAKVTGTLRGVCDGDEDRTCPPP